MMNTLLVCYGAAAFLLLVVAIAAWPRHNSPDGTAPPFDIPPRDATK